MGTSVDVEALADEYTDAALEPRPIKLVVDALAKLLTPSMLLLPGDGIAGVTLLSLSFDSPRFFGFENSFILELFDLGSFSGGNPGGGAME